MRINSHREVLVSGALPFVWRIFLNVDFAIKVLELMTLNPRIRC